MFKFLKYLFKDFFIFSAAYSNDVFPEPLDKEEEKKCIEILKEGNKEARAKLIEHNLRLVAHIVKKYDNNTNNNDDLISIGTIGLIKGIDSYSKSHNTRITTYIAKCVENEIRMYFRNNKKHSKNVSINENNYVSVIKMISNVEDLYLEFFYDKRRKIYVNTIYYFDKKFNLKFINDDFIFRILNPLITELINNNHYRITSNKNSFAINADNSYNILANDFQEEIILYLQSKFKNNDNGLVL